MVDLNTTTPENIMPVDVIEYANNYVYVFDMPGFTPNDIMVEVEDGNVLVVKGVRDEIHELPSELGQVVKRLSTERSCTLSRRIVLQDDANVESISAVCQDGLLSVTLKKKIPKKPLAVPVEAGKRKLDEVPGCGLLSPKRHFHQIPEFGTVRKPNQFPGSIRHCRLGPSGLH